MESPLTTEDVFAYIKREEKEYQNGPGVPVIDDWNFRMYWHIRDSLLRKYGQLTSRQKTIEDPVENIILPILNVAYRLEDVELKDIVPYVDNSEYSHLSFLVKKYHDRWARKRGINTFLDKIKTERIDFGLCLVKKGKNGPESVPLQTIAFCDQADILSGPICLKHQYPVDQLLEMKGVWNADKIDEAITHARGERTSSQAPGQKAKTPGHYIEVYELHGVFPETMIPEKEDPDPDKYARRIFIVSYYKSESNPDNGIMLYGGRIKENMFDALKRDEIHGRACGYGGAEELFEAQIWHTFSQIQKKEMLETAANMIVITTDELLAKRQNLNNLEKGELLKTSKDTETKQLVISPINWAAFDQWQEQCKASAQTTGSANDPQLGVEPKAGTPFALQKLTTVQGQGIHEYRHGILCDFIEKLYRESFLEQMAEEMNEGDKWMEELSLEEIKWVAEKASAVATFKKKKEMVLSGKSPTETELEDYKESVKRQWIAGEKRRPLEIIQGQINNIAKDIKINVANKQKDFGAEVGKIFEFIKMIVSTGGQVLTVPGMDDLLNQVIEYLGLNPVNFAAMLSPKKPQQPAQGEQSNQLPAATLAKRQEPAATQ